MKIKITLIIMLFACLISHAQYEWTPGKVVLKNGTSLKGLVKIPRVTRGGISISKSKLEYKKEKKGSKIKFDHTQVDRIYIATSNPNLGYYEYVSISNKRLAIFKLIRNGKSKLYTRTIKLKVSKGFQNSVIQKKKEYYIIRENENVATRVTQKLDELSFNYKGRLKSFKKNMKTYFDDCPNVVTYIENDIYDDFDIATIVDDYNLLCE